MTIVDYLRMSYGRWKKRLGELFTKFDEGVETVLCCGIMWQAWRIWHFAHDWKEIYVNHGTLSQAAIDMSKDARTFYAAAFDLESLSWLLICITACCIYGLMEKREVFRIVGTIAATGWWFVSGTLLTIHSPLHDAGGLYYILGASGVIIYAHRFVMLDREKNVVLIDAMVDVYCAVYTFLYRRRRLNKGR